MAALIIWAAIGIALLLVGERLRIEALYCAGAVMLFMISGMVID